MATLEEVTLEVVSRSDDFENQIGAAHEILALWNQIFGERTPSEKDLMDTKTGALLYAFTIFVHATRLFPNPGTAASLRAARQDIVSRAAPPPVANVIADE